MTRAGYSADGDSGTEPRPWEISVAWLRRLLILATATVPALQGKYLYALMCIAAIAVLVAPPLLVRTSRANMSIEVKLAALWGAVGDMTLGRHASSR